MNFDSWLLFTSIALIATITPGPAILLVSTHSVTFGVKSSVATMAGNVTGLFIMSLLSVMGLSAIILHSAPIFFLLKVVGAGYLIYLGVKLWRQGFSLGAIGLSGGGGEQSRPGIMKLYGNGLLVALSNPKAIAFTTALFPQFIHPEHSMAQQFFILIATFMSLSFVCLLAYAVMAAETKNRSARIILPSVMSKVFGCAFVGSGVFLATATQK
jgi:homoserine/homoserine lactone efflux protein